LQFGRRGEKSDKRPGPMEKNKLKKGTRQIGREICNHKESGGDSESQNAFFVSKKHKREKRGGKVRGRNPGKRETEEITNSAYAGLERSRKEET